MITLKYRLQIINFKLKEVLIWIYKHKFLFFIFFFALLFFREFIFLSNISPSDFDESNLFCGVKQFYYTGSLKAFNCINEDRSFIGGYSWYGPFINIIYGSIVKVFGFSNSIFFYINFLSLIISLFISTLLFKNKRDKIQYLYVFLSSFLISFVFVYFPENFVILLSLILLLVYTKIKSFKSVVFFSILILCFSLIRITLVFWIFSILFFSNKLISIKIKITIFTSVFTLILIYIKLFTAPSSISGLGDIHGTSSFDFSNTITHISKNFYTNIYRLFDRANPSIIFFMYSLILLSSNYFFNFKKKRLKNFALYLVVLITFLIFLTLYSSYWYFFEKQISFVLPIIFYLIIKDFSINYKRYYIIICLCLFLPISITKLRQNAIDKKNAYNQNQKDFSVISNIFSFKNKIDLKTKKEITILFKRDDFEIESSRLMSLFPVSFKNKPIMYTSNIGISEDENRIFKLHDKIQIDYIISSKKLYSLTNHLVYNNDKVYLYELKKNN